MMPSMYVRLNAFTISLQCTDVTLHTTLDFLAGSKHNSKLTILKRQNVNIVDWDVYYDFS